jgi:predicted RNA binding protein YcfA (HicA-like mRNA interferase family)
MKLPRDLSGKDLSNLLCRKWDYRVIHQEGSHLVLETDLPSRHRIAIPAHKSLRIGTLSAILRSVAHHKGVEPRQTARITLELDSVPPCFAYTTESATSAPAAGRPVAVKLNVEIGDPGKAGSCVGEC